MRGRCDSSEANDVSNLPLLTHAKLSVSAESAVAHAHRLSVELLLAVRVGCTLACALRSASLLDRLAGNAKHRVEHGLLLTVLHWPEGRRRVWLSWRLVDVEARLEHYGEYSSEETLTGRRGDCGTSCG